MKQDKNRDTWVGFRPSVMPTKKGSKKGIRRESKQMCRDAMKGGI